MIVKLLTEHHFVFLSLKERCTGSSEPTLVKMQHCWKLLAMAHYYAILLSFSTAAFCLVVNPILVYSHGFLFHYMKVDQSSDSTKTLT